MSIINHSKFELHHQLAADSLFVTSLELSELLLINDCRFTWCVLVPRLADLRDLHDVPKPFKSLLLDEMDLLSTIIKNLANTDKMNVASLGNMVEQLHIHIIGRHESDTAWPAPVWGHGTAVLYSTETAEQTIQRLRQALEID